jgi:hypothetical protein
MHGLFVVGLVKKKFVKFVYTSLRTWLEKKISSIQGNVWKAIPRVEAGRKKQEESLALRPERTRALSSE